MNAIIEIIPGIQPFAEALLVGALAAMIWWAVFHMWGIPPYPTRGGRGG